MPTNYKIYNTDDLRFFSCPWYVLEFSSSVIRHSLVLQQINKYKPNPDEKHYNMCVSELSRDPYEMNLFFPCHAGLVVQESETNLHGRSFLRCMLHEVRCLWPLYYEACLYSTYFYCNGSSGTLDEGGEQDFWDFNIADNLMVQSQTEKSESITYKRK